MAATLPPRFRALAIALLALSIAGCGDGSGDTPSSMAARFAILSAFPGELRPHVERAVIEKTTVIEDHRFRVGTIEGVPVVMALTGIGLVNAATTTRLLLEHFAVQGIAISAVAGSTRLRIGDVAVPAQWTMADGTTYTPRPQWLDMVGTLVASDAVALERCTLVPSASDEPVCLTRQPAIIVGGVGRSSDPFGTMPVRCRPGGGEVFGCDVATSESLTAGAGAGTTDTEAPNVDDMETAAIAREAAARGVPFIAFRAVSDGPGDPLGLPAYLAQFNAYYGLAARNAAATTVAFLKRVTLASTPGKRPPTAQSSQATDARVLPEVLTAGGCTGGATVCGRPPSLVHSMRR